MDGPVPVPWKPNSVLDPAATLPLKATFPKLTAPDEPLACAFHVFVTAAPDGRVSAAVQPARAVEPALTRTVATNPPVHWFSEIVAVQPCPAGGGVDGGGGVGVVGVGQGAQPRGVAVGLDHIGAGSAAHPMDSTDHVGQVDRVIGERCERVDQSSPFTGPRRIVSDRLVGGQGHVRDRIHAARVPRF